MNKNWYQSKTIWAGIIIALCGIAQVFDINLPYDVIYSLAGAFGLYGIRDAIDKNK